MNFWAEDPDKENKISDLDKAIAARSRSVIVYLVTKLKFISYNVFYLVCWKGLDVQDISKLKHIQINDFRLIGGGHNCVNGIENLSF